MSLNILDTYAAAIAALFGGIGVKIIEKLMSKRSEQFLEGTKIREELRQEITSLKKDVDASSKSSDEWREKYYQKVEENLELSQEIDTLQNEIVKIRNQFPPSPTTPTTK